MKRKQNSNHKTQKAKTKQKHKTHTQESSFPRAKVQKQQNETITLKQSANTECQHRAPHRKKQGQMRKHTENRN